MCPGELCAPRPAPPTDLLRLVVQRVQVEEGRPAAMLQRLLDEGTGGAAVAVPLRRRARGPWEASRRRLPTLPPGQGWGAVGLSLRSQRLPCIVMFRKMFPNMYSVNPGVSPPPGVGGFSRVGGRVCRWTPTWGRVTSAPGSV